MDSEVAEILRLCRGLDENDWHQVKSALDEMEQQKLKAEILRTILGDDNGQ